MTAAVAGLAWLDAVGRSLRTGFDMFWETLWPLILGFGLSGAVQAFANRRRLGRTLGDHRPGAVARASAYGMASSSCSYAAAAMGKSLFAKGADFVAVCVFMFASTNLVVELGLVLAVLMGWQFAAAEYAGGVIMIVLLTTVGGLWLRGRRIARARAAVAADPVSGHPDVDEAADPGPPPWAVRLRSRGGWVDAATYTVTDLTMLRFELVAGFVVAGFVATVVPVDAWNALFWPGHGVWTDVENVVVGPLVAVVSFVCSIGNVPLAAALWHGGISFGGVVSFLFADLIALPLLLIYRRYYGPRLMLRMLAVFWLVMSVAGLLTQGLFPAAGLIPARRAAEIGRPPLAGDVTTALNIVFLGLFAVVYWAYRHRQRLGGGRGTAIDPVCGMTVDRASAPATATVDGQPVYFCSEGCRDHLDRAPAA